MKQVLWISASLPLFIKLKLKVQLTSRYLKKQLQFKAHQNLSKLEKQYKRQQRLIIKQNQKMKGRSILKKKEIKLILLSLSFLQLSTIDFLLKDFDDSLDLQFF